MSWLITILRDVPDPRTENATRHALLDLLTIALTASICGCESCVEFADFAEDRVELFREFLCPENGLPSHDTFSGLFRLIDPQALSGCFGRFLDALGADGRLKHTHIYFRFAFFPFCDSLALARMSRLGVWPCWA